jgi:uracil-DNA glycosylase
MQSETRTELLKMLDWYQAMGVDAAVSAEPIDWFEHTTSQASRTTSRATETPVATGPAGQRPSAAASAAAIDAAPPSRRVTASLGPSDAESSARELAKAAASLTELRQHLESFDGCALKATAKSLCFFRGTETARIAIIGEAPGRDEDIAGKPFVGRAGQLLDKMLAAIGLTEADVHITNVVYWRPPGNRTPTPAETQICRPFLDRQLELVKPEFVLVLGGAAAKNLLGVNDGIMRLRGKWRTLTIAGQDIQLMPTLHPAYLLRTPAAKRQAWRDLLSLQQALAKS